MSAPLQRLLSLTGFCLLAFPLTAQNSGYWHTSGNQIVDSNNQTVRIAGVNWYGFENSHQVGQGLWIKDYHVILNSIKNNGYNTIRLPFSNQMVEAPVVPDNIQYLVNNSAINTDLKGLNALQIMDKVIDYAGQIGLRVILDNHRSSAGDTGTESYLWYTDDYPESVWLKDWRDLTTRYLNNPTVVGIDLRNEPHNPEGSSANNLIGACWGCGDVDHHPLHDWKLAAERGGNAVLAINPNLLIFVEGNDCYDGECNWWGGNLEGVKYYPVMLSVPNRLVYSAHEYGPALSSQPWFTGSTSTNDLTDHFYKFWGYVSDSAPVWVGEFGTPNHDSDTQDATPGSQGQWFGAMVDYLHSRPQIGWTYWAINGEDPYGLLGSNYDPTPANALKQQALATLQSPVAGTPLRFVPMNPCRLVDTRQDSGPFGGPWLTTQGTRDFVLTQSNCGIPGNAQAYALNVTAVPEKALSWLTVWPKGQSQPLVSTLNSDGRVKANAAIVPAGDNGGLSVFATDNTHVILDIFGYFVKATDDPGLQFFPLAPCRIADTRADGGPLGGPSLGAGQTRTFPVLLSNCGLSISAKAYSMNITAVPKTALSYLTVWPSGQNQPLVSTLNATIGATTANGAIIPAGSNGDIAVFAKNDTDLVIDVNGYFAPPDTGGLSLYNVRPCRLRDTRNDRGSNGISGTIGVRATGGMCDVAYSAQAFVTNATVVPQAVQGAPASLGWLTLYPEGQERPTVSTLNAVDGQVSSNLAIVPAGAAGLVDVFATNWTHFILDISGYFAP